MANKKFPNRRRRQESPPEFSTNYEKYVNLMETYRKEAYQQVFAERELTERNISRAKKALRLGVTGETKKQCETIIQVGTKFINKPLKTLSRIEGPLIDSHLFLVGPATSESLFGFKPTDYGYIENGKLPFDNCYFELIEGVETKLPGLTLDAKLEGVQISHRGLFDARKDLEEMMGSDIKNFTEEQIQKEVARQKDEETTRNYDIHAFLNLGKYGPAIFRTEFDVTRQREFGTGSLILPYFKERIGFLSPGTMKIINGEREAPSLDKMSFEVEEFAHLHQPYPFSNYTQPAIPPQEIRDLNPKKAAEFIESLYCFGVNMINYVNSHNVTVEKREGRINPPSTSRNLHSKQYNLITVRDEVHYTTDDPQETDRHLEYRIYVRGHPRRLKNEQGVIYKTTWVSPCIKGPEDAPFREQRYQVLAEKLLREREFNRIIAEKGYQGVKDFRKDTDSKQ